VYFYVTNINFYPKKLNINSILLAAISYYYSLKNDASDVYLKKTICSHELCKNRADFTPMFGLTLM
jgi:hypothetical protein